MAAETAMAMLAGYFDAAGDNKVADALTVGGYIAPLRSWARFRRDWRKVLNAVGIDTFHMTDFIACQDGFEHWAGRQQAQSRVLKRLATVISRHLHYSPATTVVMSAWNALNQEFELRECHATPYALAAFTVMNKSLRWIGRVHPQDSIAQFVFERGDCGRGDFDHLMGWVRELARDRIPEHIWPVEGPKELEALQAADFSSWEQRYVASRRTVGISDGFRESMGVLLSLKSRNDWGVLDRARLRLLIEHYQIPKRSTIKRSQREQAKWRPAPYAQIRETQRSKPRTQHE